jgi:Ca-activated chloride channel homolog
MEIFRTAARGGHSMRLWHQAQQIKSRPISSILLLFIFSICSVLAGGSYSVSRSSSTSPQAKITVTSALVVLPVNVTNANGKFVDGLKAENFRIYEGGRQQNITLFKDEDMPVTVDLIVDHSRSMGPKLFGVISAVRAFAHSSNPGDEMFVVDFNENVSVELLGGKAFTSDVGELEKAIYAVSARGQTALYDAVTEGLTHIELGQQDKKALIVVSDGGDNASRIKFSEVLALAWRSRVAIYCIGLVDESGDEENPRILEKLSKATGGITFLTRRTDEVTEISKQIARELREQYTLGYVPPLKNGRDSFRKIRVDVSAPGGEKVRVRTRPGYYLDGAKTQASLVAGVRR